MDNIIQLHPKPTQPQTKWNGPEDITVGQLPDGQHLEITIDKTDDGNVEIIVPHTPYPGRVGYVLTNEQAAQLASSIYEAMNATARQYFHDRSQTDDEQPNPRRGSTTEGEL